MNDAVYSVEGVMVVEAGWLLALNRPFAGEMSDRLAVDAMDLPVTLTVAAIVESENGTTRDVIVSIPAGVYDARLLTGRIVRAG